MRQSIWMVSLLALITASSCIPNKDLVYLQENQDRTDSLQYAREVQKPYRVQIDDILNIMGKNYLPLILSQTHLRKLQSFMIKTAIA